MDDSDRDTSRTVVKTYVPAFQREEWDTHAEDLDMSRSEFVRSMVQAGRRGFEGNHRPDRSRADTAEDPNAGRAGATPDGLETTVLDALSVDEFLSWDELRAVVTDDIEERLEATLQELQTTGRIRYSGRNGGYTLDE
jgi:hypothetical protein